MTVLQQIHKSLAELSDAQRVQISQRYFKTGTGQYGMGDQFIGVKVPDQRRVARQFYSSASLDAIKALLQSPIHEHRLTALFMLTLQFQKAENEALQKSIVDFYLENLYYINNWDLVDSSAPPILGAWLYTRPKVLLYELAASGDIWKQRIAIVSTYYFIKKGAFDDTLALAKTLLNHKHDLIHKATGWMLREVGNRNQDMEANFLIEHYHEMPRTMLRYAIEKFPENLRLQFLKGII